jgi:hypothetical protein
MNTSTALDTIAGSKLLQLRFGRAGDFQPDQAVIHEDRRARFIGVSDGAAIIRYWGDARTVAVPLESLALPSANEDDLASRVPAVARARNAAADRTRLVRRPRLGWFPQRRPALRP